MAVTLKGEDVRRNAIQKPTVVTDYDRAARKVFEGFLESCQRVESMSLVGSSSSRTLAPVLSIFARCTRLRSPPESVAHKLLLIGHRRN